MAHRTPKPLRAVGSLLRALTGLVLLLAMVGGAPLALLTFGHQPTELTGGINLLLEQDDGTLWLVALTCIGWGAWAAFAFSVVVEIIAVARRRSAPRIRGLGSMQSLASFLVGGIVLLAPTAASAATATPAVAVTQAVDGPTATARATLTSTATPSTDFPTHTVTSATETPWDLAEEYLGNGQRWRDIAALNPDTPELASGDQYLPTSAVIKLPLDARPTTPAAAPTLASATPAPDSTAAKSPAPHHAPAVAEDVGDKASDAGTSSARQAPEHDEVTVAPGDSLWAIAGDEYGDPTAWRHIYKANEGEAQSGGRHFDDPDLIIPGQQLDLPDLSEHAETPAGPDTGQDTPATPPQNKPADRETDSTAPSGDVQDTERDQEQKAPPASASAPSAAPEPSSAAPSAPAPSDSPAPAKDSASPVGAPMAWTATGVVAAALVGTLAVRRRRQQHRRRPGRRIAMPKGRAAATEQGLRNVQTPTGFELLNVGLRSLALNLQAAGRDLPALNGVVLHESRLELHLAQAAPPCAPFTAPGDRQDVWTCSANHPDLADTDALDGVGAPYPALVSIGWDSQGRYVLVDLEHIGLLRLDGDADVARHVLQAIAVELANTPVAGHLEVTALGQTVPGLETAVPERVARSADINAATAELTAHTRDQRSALTALGADSPRAARLSNDAGDWTPHIVLAEQLPYGPTTEHLLSTLTGQPRTASAVITASTTADLPDEAWTLSCQNEPTALVALPESGLLVRLQTLDDDRFNDAIELLTTADTDTDVPAAPVNTDLITDDDEGLDGLPDEYAALEEEAFNDEVPVPEQKFPVPVTAVIALPEESQDTGESLADVLTSEEEDTGGAEAPAAGPVNVSLAQATPCAVPTSAVHASLPAPAQPQADDHAADDEPGEALADVLASDAADDAPPARPTRSTPRRRVSGPDNQPTGASLTDDEPAPNGPSILLLGQLAIDGATGRVDSNRKSVATELLAFLALHPGSDHHAVDSALWPTSRVNKEMRNAVVSRARSWLGTDTDGNQHLPRVQNTPDKRYRLGPRVTCDWLTFQHHARQGLTDHSEDGDLALRRALALVRGRPFAGMDPQRYAWAEPIIQEMVSAITDVASELSTRRSEARDPRGALWAAQQGLLAVEDSETLYRALFLAHHAVGDIGALREAAARLRRINDSIGGGVEMEADTAELLRHLLPRPIHAH
ncbi:LysM peptidoglycan-binding domain-containing protein [Streptomyces olivaceus]|uniref:LysM peptidoglycan-binding domain-containing protein n=1 Tax=Streptomyces olivaceus TaxID=47716 RepID=UPI001CCBFF2E|nr:LysM peptidoglycan-binding domain-containing protein [Streptomyces olivaceus]MBZ6295895.1 LysM peptidoglycan-binding domain-containing protein [Streptomyces olivaceus]MBZ6330873.1 LysM peptidoglycan-binding domain-containing protein [Streptomyces olivaceus]